MEHSDIIAVAPADAAGPSMELTQWESWQWTKALKDPPTLSVSGVPGEHASAALIAETENDIFLIRDGVTLYRGRIADSDDSLDADGGAPVNFTSVGYRGLLSRRVLLRAKDYVGVDQADIAWDLIVETQTYNVAPYLPNTLGITAAALPAGQPRDRHWEPGASVGELLSDLSEVINGFEWEVDAHKVFRIGHPRLGAVRDVALDFGGYLNGLNRKTNTGSFANGVWFGGGAGTFPVYVQDGDPPAGMLFMASFSDPDVVVQQTVQDKAERALAEMKVLRRSWTAEVPAHRWDPSLFDVGDTASLSVSWGRLDAVEIPVRLVEQVVAVDANGAQGVTYTLVEGDEP